MSPDFGERVVDGDGTFCYRHREQQSFVLCQRCGNTICGECQTPAPVGVLCPDCVAEAQRTNPAPKRSIGSTLGSETPIVTYVIMGLCAVVFAGQWVTQNIPGLPSVTEVLWYAPLYSMPQAFEPWRMLTTVFTHSPNVILHILLNMYTLWLFGRQLESYLGRGRYATLYLISGFAGSLAVMLWSYVDPAAIFVPVVGASGAIFGLMGAFMVIGRHLGGNITSLIVLLVINLGIGFLPGATISWQAHVGGLLGGAVVALIYMRTRRFDRVVVQRWLVIGWAAALVIGSLAFFWASPVAIVG